jgi:hypothetical protein
MGKSKKETPVEVPKSNCLACGKEHDYDSKYCKHCGAPAEPETQKVPQYLKGKKPRKKLFVALIIVILIIATISVIIIISFEDMDEIVTYTYSPENTPSSLKIELDMNNGSVEIEFTDELTEPVVKLDYHKKWSGWIYKQPSFETSSNKVTFIGSTVFGEADSELTVILRSDVEYDIHGTMDSGSIALHTDNQGVILGTVDFDSSSGSATIFGVNLTITEQIKLRSEDGSASVKLKDCTIGDIDGTFSDGSSAINLEKCTIEDIHISGEDGSFSIISKDSKIDSNSSWTFDVDSGSVALNIEQSISLGSDITVDASITGNKKIKVNFNGNAASVRAKFTGNKEINIKENTGFDILNSKTLESSNFNNSTVGKFEIKMTADRGDLEVEAVSS